ncbi:MAG: CPBP family intramembrane metalloprotease, partial [bacterium]|nr:CPBP family intramembrane metalloprotease [bacterium]
MIPVIAAWYLIKKGTTSLVISILGLQVGILLVLLFAAGTLARVLFGVWPGGRFLDRRTLADVGFRFNKAWWIDFVMGMGLGILMQGIIFGIQFAAGWITVTGTFHTFTPDKEFILLFLPFFAFYLSVALAEEWFYRGYLLTNLAEGLNFKKFGSKGPQYAIIAAVVISSVAFGIFHLNNPNTTFLSTVTIVLYGILFGTTYILTGSLALPIGLHLTWNLFLGNVFGFPVSGDVFPSIFVSVFSITQSGPEAWTGGAFGPEAGL